MIVVNTSVGPNTHAQYTQIAQQHINPSLGDILLRDLQPHQVQMLYTNKLAEGTSPRTTRLIHSVLHAALNHALKLGLVIRNVSDAVTLPKVTRKEMKTLDDYQVRLLIQSAEGTRMQALFWLAVTTGMRMGEILGLKWKDFDRNSGNIQIRSSKN